MIFTPKDGQRRLVGTNGLGNKRKEETNINLTSTVGGGGLQDSVPAPSFVDKIEEDFIEQARSENEEAVAEITNIENVMGNTRKIINE